jgi:hypothetical protein
VRPQAPACECYFAGAIAGRPAPPTAEAIVRSCVRSCTARWDARFKSGRPDYFPLKVRGTQTLSGGSEPAASPGVLTRVRRCEQGRLGTRNSRRPHATSQAERVTHVSDRDVASRGCAAISRATSPRVFAAPRGAPSPSRRPTVDWLGSPCAEPDQSRLPRSSTAC